MKKSRILISSVFLAGAIAASIAAAGCSHKHTYSGDWTSDEANHWHAATCDHADEKQDLGAHEYDENYKCTVCDFQHVHTFDSNVVCTGCNYSPADKAIIIVKGTTEYTLDSSTTMSIPMDDYLVKIWKENGMSANEITDYTPKYYKEDKEIPNLNNVTEGSYNVWATANINGKPMEYFIVIYVMDEVESISVKPGEGTFEQEVGANTMSETWKYLVTFKSGDVKEVGAKDVKVDGLVTNKVSEEGAKAKASYTYENVKGNKKTVEVEVPYTVKAGSGIKIETTVFSADTLTVTTANTTEDTILVDGVMTAKPGIAVDGNKKSYTDDNDSANNRSFTQRLKLNGAGNTTSRSVEIVTVGKAKIVVYAQSASSSDVRKLALAKSTYKDWLTTSEEIIGSAQDCATDKLVRLEYEVTEAGSYYLVSTSGGINIYGVEVSVEVESSGTPGTSQNVIVGSEQLAVGDITTKKELATGISVMPAPEGSAAVTIDTNSKSYAADNKSFTTRLKLGGEGKKDSRSIEIVTTGKAKIVVYAMSSSSAATREVGLYNSTFVDKTATPNAIIGGVKECPGDKLYKLEWEVGEAGTYYFACLASGLNVYGIEIIYD